MRSRHGRNNDSIQAKISKKITAKRREKLLHDIREGDVEAVTKYVAKYGANRDEINFRDGHDDFQISKPLMAVCGILTKPDLENAEPTLQILRVLLSATAINDRPHEDHEFSALEELGRHATPVSQQAFAIMWQHCSVYDKNRARGDGTALMIAVKVNAHANFELMMADPQVNIPGRIVRDNEYYAGYTNQALFLAATHYRPEMFCKMYANIGIELSLESCLAGMSYFLFRLLNDERIADRFKIAATLIKTKNFDINTKDEHGRTLLMFAIEKKQKNIIQALLNNPGIDVNVKDANGETPLMRALSMRDQTTADMLIARNDIRDLQVKDQSGRMAMMVPDDEMSYTYLEKLMANKDFDVNSPIDGLTTFLYALKNRRSRLAEKLAARKDLQNINAVDENGKTALLVAMQERYQGGYDQRKAGEKIVPLLLARPDIDVSLPDKTGMTPLLYAVTQCSLTDTHPFIMPLLRREDLREINARDSQGRTALYIAIANHQTKQRAGHHRPDYDFSRVFYSLAKMEGVDINLADNNGITPLLLAASIGEFGIAHTLMTNPKIANVNARDKDGKTTLLIAVTRGDEYLIAKLLANKEIDINAADSTGMTPLLQAVLNGNVKLASNLLARSDIQNLNATDVHGNTVLTIATLCHYQEIFDLLLAKDGVDLNAANKKGATPLMAAIAANNTSLAIKLIAKLDASAINVKDEQGNSALFCAVAKHVSEVFSALIAKDGVDINAKDNQNNTPLLKALQLGYKEYSLRLLERKDVDVTVVDNDGSCCVSNAAYHGFSDILAALLERIEVNIDLVNQCFEDGRSALMYALEYDNIECAKMLLIPLVVNMNIVSKDGKTALKIAAEKNNINMLNLLLDHGAEVDQADANGDTLLIEGVRSKNRAIVRVALAHGASLAHKNLKGDNALLEAVKSGDSVMLGYLLERMTQHPQAGIDMHELFFMAVKRNDRNSLGQLLEHVKQTPEMQVDIYEAFIEAVSRNNEVMVDSIYKYGVDLSYICEKTGRTALETALNQKSEAMAAKLFQFEAESKLEVAQPVVVEAIAAKPVRQPSLLSKHFFLSVKEVEPKSEAIEDKQKEEANAVVEGTITLDVNRAFC